MRPARYFPKRSGTTLIINNLVYVMDCMLERERPQRDGIALVCNLAGFTMANFTVNYIYKFLMALQAKKSPTRVQLLLFVDPPGWFGSVWGIMKPMMGEDFKKRVHIIKRDDLNRFLPAGCEEWLPDDMLHGKKDTNKMVKDFILERRQIESSRMLSSNSLR